MSSRASPRKRVSEADVPQTPPSTPQSSKKLRKSPSKTPGSPAPPATLTGPVVDAPLTVESKLSFDYETAKAHLINADPRFEVMFRKVPCKPFEDAVDVEAIESGQRDSSNHVNPYRSLVTSILGQQISWLAARAITHRFIRLYFPHLPEKYVPGLPAEDFPTPIQVFETPISELRSAGLSQRKAEYIQDISARFADGRLTAEKLFQMTDEQMREALIAVRGIGGELVCLSAQHVTFAQVSPDWSVDMYSIFTMRRPDILGPGDLGLQKGLIRWYGYDKPAILPAKMVKVKPPLKPSESTADVFSSTSQVDVFTVPPSVPADKEDLPDIVIEPLTATDTAKEIGQITADDFPDAPPFPASETLTKDKLKARMSKKIKGNIYLTPKEMEELTESWRPYRSLGMYFMWSLAGESGE